MNFTACGAKIRLWERRIFFFFTRASDKEKFILMISLTTVEPVTYLKEIQPVGGLILRPLRFLQSIRNAICILSGHEQCRKGLVLIFCFWTCFVFDTQIIKLRWKPGEINTFVALPKNAWPRRQQECCIRSDPLSGCRLSTFTCKLLSLMSAVLKVACHDSKKSLLR